MMTNLETRYMSLIATCEMNANNGAEPKVADDVNTYTWPEERAADLGITERALGGVMTSLQNKGLIWVSIDPSDPDDNGVGFTEEGFDAWRAAAEAANEVEPEPTAEVYNSFGRIEEVTRDEFVTRWVDQAKQFYKLTPSATFDEVGGLVDRVRSWADAEFTRMLGEDAS